MKEILAKVKGDKIIWGVVLLLSLLSLLVVYSSTCSLAFRHSHSSNYYLIKQLVVLAAGLLITWGVHTVNYTKFAKVAIILYLISLPLLLYTLLFGATYNDGARWVRVPGINLTFQSSDLAKLALFMFLARMLSVKQAVIKDLKTGFIPVVTPLILTCAFIAPENLSTSLMLGATCTIVFFIGRVRVRHIFLLLGFATVAISLLFIVSMLTGFGRGRVWKARVEDFVGTKKKQENKTEGKSDGKGDGKQGDVFQVQQAKIAIANGGFFGLGPGNSRQRNNLPHPYSDFIYAIIIEEYGLFGGAVIMILYLVFLWRSILIYRRCPYAFGAFLAVGLSITLVIQAFLNMAVNVHLVPVTGLTLPMVSMGGSSIWFTSIAIGIILSVSRYVDEMEGNTKGSPKKQPDEKGPSGTATDAPDGLESKILIKPKALKNQPIPAAIPATTI
jgi:cell division protein FtsW